MPIFTIVCYSLFMSSVTFSGQHILTSEEAEEILAPYRERLNRCIQHGWDAWKKEYEHKHHILNARARAAIIFDEIVFYALAEFPTEPGLKAVRTPSTFMLYIGDCMTLRFKKIRKNGKCSNILTRQQVLFRAQVQLNLPTILDGTLVSTGYVLDDLQQEILRKSVVCHLDNDVLWELPLSVADAPVIEFIPPAATPSSAPAQSSRFEPKPGLVPEVPKIKSTGEDK